MTFIKNMWYVAAWSHELGSDAPIGRIIVGEPIAFYRKSDGAVVAMEDRCPHRHAPLSMGRIRGDDLQCMYHGMTLSCEGACKSIPGSTEIPRNTHVRVYPVAESSSWIWVWTGDPAKADVKLIPTAMGLDDPEFATRSSALDYAANYQLINDNLCDLSHVDYTHETTLGAASGSRWSDDHPKVTQIENGLLIERWFQNQVLTGGDGMLVDSWSAYSFVLPGLFLMEIKVFPTGTAAASNFLAPTAVPMFRRREQQAVTPRTDATTRYLYASGIEAKVVVRPEILDGYFAVINAAFAEDKQMIEAQQIIWNHTAEERRKAYLLQDKAPTLFRHLINTRLAGELADKPV